jgi:squalene-hopene/tetraprenyl-beta-curcumene cyclase
MIPRKRACSTRPQLSATSKESTMCATPLRYLAAVFVIGGGLSVGWSRAADHPGWDGQAAARYLDGRATAWFAFPSADRGRGEDKITCLSCHTLLPFALARPVLRRLASGEQPAGLEERTLAQVRRRVAHWDELDTPRFRLLYDSDDEKKAESRGTEAVLSAWILARDDRDRGLPGPSESTRQSLRHVWSTQLVEGEEKGSWPWINFGMGPWESDASPYYGAAVAAIAVGTAVPDRGVDNEARPRARIELLRDYLRRRYQDQDLHNRLWALWASTTLDGLLSAGERDQLIGQVLAKQRDDGGWRLASFGDYTRQDHTPQAAESDGYATGLVLHVLQLAGLGRDHPGVAKGLAWLRANQQPTGAWVGHSLNKRRNPDTQPGKFMSDAATAFAILALDHPDPSRTRSGGQP